MSIIATMVLGCIAYGLHREKLAKVKHEQELIRAITKSRLGGRL
jgi:hypothetical protein